METIPVLDDEYVFDDAMRKSLALCPQSEHLDLPDSRFFTHPRIAKRAQDMFAMIVGYYDAPNTPPLHKVEGKGAPIVVTELHATYPVSDILLTTESANYAMEVHPDTFGFLEIGCVWAAFLWEGVCPPNSLMGESLFVSTLVCWLRSPAYLKLGLRYASTLQIGDLKILFRMAAGFSESTRRTVYLQPRQFSICVAYLLLPKLPYTNDLLADQLQKVHEELKEQIKECSPSISWLHPYTPSRHAVQALLGRPPGTALLRLGEPRVRRPVLKAALVEQPRDEKLPVSYIGFHICATFVHNSGISHEPMSTPFFDFTFSRSRSVLVDLCSHSSYTIRKTHYGRYVGFGRIATLLPYRPSATELKEETEWPRMGNACWLCGSHVSQPSPNCSNCIAFDTDLRQTDRVMVWWKQCASYEYGVNSLVLRECLARGFPRMAVSRYDWSLLDHVNQAFLGASMVRRHPEEIRSLRHFLVEYAKGCNSNLDAWYVPKVGGFVADDCRGVWAGSLSVPVFRLFRLFCPHTAPVNHVMSDSLLEFGALVECLIHLEWLHAYPVLVSGPQMRAIFQMASRRAFAARKYTLVTTLAPCISDVLIKDIVLPFDMVAAVETPPCMDVTEAYCAIW